MSKHCANVIRIQLVVVALLLGTAMCQMYIRPPPHVGNGPLSGHSASIRSGRLDRNVGGGSQLEAEWIDLMTIQELAINIPELSMLGSIYDETEMGFKLEQSRHVTVFMPSNEAIKKRNLHNLFPLLPYEVRIRILHSHILDSVVKADEIPDGEYKYTNEDGSPLLLSISRRARLSGTWLPDTPRRDSVSAAEIVNNRASMDRGSSLRREGMVGVSVRLGDGGSEALVVNGTSIDTANGVSYVIDDVLIPTDLQGLLLKAEEEFQAQDQGLQSDLQEDGTATGDGPSANPSIRGEGDRAVPAHIEKTNRHHWYYGRVGGTPVELAAHPPATDADGNTMEYGGPDRDEVEILLEMPSPPPAVQGLLTRQEPSSTQIAESHTLKRGVIRQF